ncbi:MAG: extensin family protein [Alphaproteobacteria bacterium]|nr:extensin family protein [Alphaproteobacteria bacterium]
MLPLAAAALAVYVGVLRVPPNVVPWGDIDLEQPPGPFARMQINGLVQSPQACFIALAGSSLEYRRIADRPVRDGCGFPNGVVVERSNVPYSSGFSASCPLAAALYVYERQLRELARSHLGSDLARINHVGTYACRNVNGATAGRRSQHATANAIDISGFTLADGRRISVLRDWGTDTPAGRFLADVRDEGCGLFNTVLGPEYNDRHQDHFHLDLGRFRICR